MSDYNFLMESRLSPEQLKVLALVSRVAYEQGLNLYLVGGAVRDLTYGQQVIRDLDFAVEGNPQKILRHLESRPAPSPLPGRREPYADTAALSVEYEHFDSQLGTANLRFSNGVQAELSMCRREVAARPGQRPEVFPATIFDDLKRRDFSLNAMAVSLHPNSRGLLLDPTNGAADIELRELRVLHSRSFVEDPARIYRLWRLGLRLDFKPEERTQTHLTAALQNRPWENLGPREQACELRGILQEENPARILKLLAERKLLGGLDRKLALARIAYDRFVKVRDAAQTIPGADPFLVHFHFLVERLGRSQQARLAKKIIAEPKSIKLALELEREGKKLERLLGSSKAALPSQVYTLLLKQPLSLVLFVRVATKRAAVQNRIKSYFNKYLPMHASLPRAELQSLGVKPGAEFERILERCFLEQLDGKVKNHPQLLKTLRQLAGIKEPPPKPPAPPERPAKKAVVVAALAAAAKAKHAEAKAAKPAPRPAKPAAAKPLKPAAKPVKPVAKRPKSKPAPKKRAPAKKQARPAQKKRKR
jgi:tRNA nucleotidyltransferase (CCA-adding enzyme)